METSTEGVLRGLISAEKKKKKESEGAALFFFQAVVGFSLSRAPLQNLTHEEVFYGVISATVPWRTNDSVG